MSFKVPIVLFFFLRESILQIVETLQVIKPCKVYLISDAGRNDKEKFINLALREKVEKMITWDCQLIKNYSENNEGVYNRIGKGALWVFDQEEKAIFLEDDNIPENSFFNFCEELLERYKENDNILWICGTNYLGEYNTENKESYVFTNCMLPCGWASWSSKFKKYYEVNLDNFNSANIKKIKKEYIDKRLYRQEIQNITEEFKRKLRKENYRSWDYHLAYSIKLNKLLGISPSYNQIMNIGVDEYSVHGGTSFKNPMTKRFCFVKTRALNFPLNHPLKIERNIDYDKKISSIMVYPLNVRLKIILVKAIKMILPVNLYKRIFRK